MPLRVGAKHETDLLLLVRGEEVDDAVDGLGRIDRVQGREHEVADLGCGQSGGHGLMISHLTDEHDIRVLPHDMPQSISIAIGVDADLALVHDALLVMMQDLDRVLDRDDMTLARGVDVVDHGCESGRLSRAGRAGDENKTARLIGQPPDDRRKPELLHGSAIGGHTAHRHPHAATLLEDVDTESTDPLERVGEVGFPVVLERLRLALVHHAPSQALSCAPA